MKRSSPKTRAKRQPRLPARAHPLVRKVVRFYLESNDFNGLPVREPLAKKPRVSAKILIDLVNARQLTVEIGDRHPNPHIRAFDEEAPEVVVGKIRSIGLDGACLYPTSEVLAKTVDPAAYAGRPYDLALARGEGQLSVRFFDLAVLEAYRNDPRFHYDCDDVGGTFSATYEASESGHLPPRDQVYIQRFGFAYDKNLDRCVAAFLRDLSSLNAEHQQLWHAREFDRSDGWSPHPGWWASMMGHWPDRVPLLKAFVAELRVINEMCRAIGWPPLFREDFSTSDRPRELAFLLRPSLSAFNSFVHLLDKVMSDNLAKEFFSRQGLALESERTREDGKVVVEKKGTIQLLEEWLLKHFRARDEAPLKNAIRVFREVRKARQRPAHAIDDSKYDPTLYRTQRELVLGAYGAVRTLRLVLANHPQAKSVEVPRWLYEGKIWPF